MTADEWLGANGKEPYRSEFYRDWYWGTEDDGPGDMQLPPDLFAEMSGPLSYPNVRRYESREDALADFRRAWVQGRGGRPMTPEELARRAAKDIEGFVPTRLAAAHADQMTAIILAAITSAVLAERERCTDLLRRFADSPERTCQPAFAFAADVIAAIRKGE